MVIYLGEKGILPEIKNGSTCLECGHQLYQSNFLDDQESAVYVVNNIL